MIEKNNIKILVVEDDEAMASLINTMLTANGYKVVIAQDGEEGERIFKNDNSFNLVITDISLPKLTGEELFYHLRAINPNLKIIASSGYGNENIISKMKEHGLNAFIPKPYIANKFIQVVKEVLES